MPKSTQPQLPREDIELLARVEGGMSAVLAQVNAVQASLQQQWQATQELAERQQDDHNDQMAKLNTKVMSVETYQATHLNQNSIERWNASASWTERFRDRLGLLLTVGGTIFTLLSGAVIWILNTFLLPILQGG